MKSVIVKDGQTLFDIAMQTLGIVDMVFELAQLNGLGITDELVSGQVIALPLLKKEQENFPEPTKSVLPKIGFVFAKDGQTLFDISIQALGIVDRVFDLAQLNGLGVTDRLESGQVITLPEVAYPQLDVVEYFAKPWTPASGGNGANDLINGGIGYMQIETNFKVS